MQLNQLIIESRPRSFWSALDLGLLVVKKAWLSYSLLWLCMAMPVLLFLSLVVQSDYIWLGFVFIWWLKPLYERPILYRLSKELFAQPIDNKTVFKEWRQWLLPSWFVSITLRRFSFSRSFLMPVVILERLEGRAYSLRTRVLRGRGGKQAFWLTIVLVHFESLLPLSVLALIGFFYPDGQEILFNYFTSDYVGAELIMNAIGLLVMATIAPLYVGCGFMLYIYRRIELEGWDIEISFRNLARRLARP